MNAQAREFHGAVMTDQLKTAPTARATPPFVTKPRSMGGRKARTHWPDDPTSAFDFSLAGIIATGLNVAALCSIFGVVEEWLLERLAKAELPAPGKRVMRQSESPNAWTVDQIRLLLILWPTNLFATSIAERIGRSPASVRYKARWLGLPARERASLTRAAPNDLPPLLPIKHGGFTEEEEIDLGNAHLRGVSSLGSAHRLGRALREIELRASDLQLPKRVFRRGKLTMQYDPNAPLLEQFRNQGWQYRKCNFSGKPFWGPRNGPRTCRAATKSKSYIEAYGGVSECNSGNKGSGD